MVLPTEMSFFWSFSTCLTSTSVRDGGVKSQCSHHAGGRDFLAGQLWAQLELRDGDQRGRQYPPGRAPATHQDFAVTLWKREGTFRWAQVCVCKCYLQSIPDGKTFNVTFFLPRPLSDPAALRWFPVSSFTHHHQQFQSHTFSNPQPWFPPQVWHFISTHHYYHIFLL